MSRLVYSMSVSLDGFVETPSRPLDWVRVDEELHSGHALLPGVRDARRAAPPRDTRTFDSGVVYLQYEAADPPRGQ